MHCVKRTTLEDLCSPKTNESYITRSVSGMESLLPLQLLSPSLCDINGWPSLAINNRSTFGLNNSATNDEDTDGISQDRLEHGRRSDSGRGNCRLKPYRDIPIYSEPGSPLFSLAYLTDEELHCSCTTSESDECFEADNCFCIRAGAPACFEGSGRTEGPMDNGIANFALDVLNHQVPSINRSSKLFFKCSGEPEPQFSSSNKAAWFRSPSSYQRRKKPSKMALGTPSLPAERKNRESWVSWLSDTSDGDDDDNDEDLVRATALAPAKTPPVIDNVNRPSRLSIRRPPIGIPPRSSSVGGTEVVPLHSQLTQLTRSFSFQSNPVGSSRPWASVHSIHSMTPTQSSFRTRLENDLPKRNPPLAMTNPPPDLAMTSPPASPKGGPPDGSSSPVPPPSLKSSRYSDLEKHSNDDTHSTFDARHVGLSAESINDLLTALENLTLHFPFATLQPDTPAILAIRSQLAPPPPAGYHQFEQSDGLLSPQFPSQDHPPAEDTISRRWSTTFSTRRRSASISISTSIPAPAEKSTEVTSPAHDYHVPHSKLYRALPPPNLQPLLRIFPLSSHPMCSSLYAYILAHIFTSSLSTAHPGRKSSKKRQDAPDWPTIEVPLKAANVLGMHGMRVEYQESPADELDWNTRVSELAETLRKSITSLVTVMDPETFQKSFKGKEGATSELGFGLGTLFIKSLEEVVRSCEMNSTGYF